MQTATQLIQDAVAPSSMKKSSIRSSKRSLTSKRKRKNAMEINFPEDEGNNLSDISKKQREIERQVSSFLICKVLICVILP